MAGEFLGTFLLVVLSLTAINYGIIVWFNFDVITTYIPQYAKIIVGAGGAIGGWMIYGMFKR